MIMQTVEQYSTRGNTFIVVKILDITYAKDYLYEAAVNAAQIDSYQRKKIHRSYQGII